MDLVKRSIIVAVIAISLLTLLAACGGGVSEEDASGQGAANTNLTERPSLLAFRSNRDRNHEIYAMNADGSEVTILTNHPESDFFPSQSSDGKKLAFVSERDGNREVYVMNSDGSNQTRLTDNDS